VVRVPEGDENGKGQGQQLYRCKECRHQFFDNGKFPRMRKPKTIVAAAFRLYFDGSSLRKVGRSLREILGTAADQRTIWRWTPKFMTQVDGLPTNFTPHLLGHLACSRYHEQAIGTKLICHPSVRSGARQLVECGRPNAHVTAHSRWPRTPAARNPRHGLPRGTAPELERRGRWTAARARMATFTGRSTFRQRRPEGRGPVWSAASHSR